LRGFPGAGFGGFDAGGFSGGGIRPDSAPGAGMDRFAGSSREGAGGNTAVLRGGEPAGHWHHGWHNGHFGYWLGYNPYLWSDDGGYDDSYAYGEPNGSQSWYYCSDPAGYYPSVTQCNTAWQTVPTN
jgi:hypothetical protein